MIGQAVGQAVGQTVGQVVGQSLTDYDRPTVAIPSHDLAH